jgi:hypothetical protein
VINKQKRCLQKNDTLTGSGTSPFTFAGPEKKFDFEKLKQSWAHGKFY